MRSTTPRPCCPGGRCETPCRRPARGRRRGTDCTSRTRTCRMHAPSQRVGQCILASTGVRIQPSDLTNACPDALLCRVQDCFVLAHQPLVHRHISAAPSHRMRPSTGATRQGAAAVARHALDDVVGVDARRRLDDRQAVAAPSWVLAQQLQAPRLDRRPRRRRQPAVRQAASQL